MLYIDAMVVKVRTSGTVINRPAYVVWLEWTWTGCKHVLGVWLGDGGEGAKLLAVGTDRDTQPRPEKTR